MVHELYMSVCCGVAVFPGASKHDDINECEPVNLYDAYRDGPCPVCGAIAPFLIHVTTFNETEVAEEWTTVEKQPVEVEARGPYTDPAEVETLEGDFEVDEEYLEEHGSYYIVRGVEGEVYPVAADIFEKTYREPTDE